jgi:iron complex outermembrane receptor protein
VYYDRSDYAIGYPIAVPGSTNLLFQEKDIGEWWGSELQLTKRLWDRHIITVGAEYRDDFRQERQFTGQPTVSTNRQSHGVYAQGDFQVLTNLHFNGGVRYDQYGEFDPRFSPRLALIYHPYEKSTLKAIYGTAFRTPNFLEVALAPPGQVGQLRPEEITSYELACEQEIGLHLRSSVSGFYNEMRHLIVVQNGSSTNCDANAAGVELAVEGSWAGGLRGRASYTFQETDNRSFDWKLPDSPNHLAKFNLSVPLLSEKLFAGLEFQYVSSRETLHNTTSSSGQPLTVQGEVASGYGIVNVTLFSQNLIKNLEFSGSVYNLLDANYGDPATRFHRQDMIAQDGRTFRVKLTYRF